MDQRKVKVVCNEENREQLEHMLRLGGFSVCNEAELVLMESGAVLKVFAARDDKGEKAFIRSEQVEYFESFGHDIFLLTIEGERYKISEKMYQLESALPETFLRIGQSVIVQKSRIKKIKPSLFQRFDLIMECGDRLTVTRGYYERFRERLGI